MKLIKNDEINNNNLEEKENIAEEIKEVKTVSKRGRKKKTLESIEEEHKEEKETKLSEKTNEEDDDKYEKIIQECKNKYGKVYGNITGNGELLIWKPLDRKEYKQIMKEVSIDDYDESLLSLEQKEELSKKRIENKFLKEESVCLKCIVYPENPKEILDKTAGLATVLSEDILMHSGFVLSPTQAL